MDCSLSPDFKISSRTPEFLQKYKETPSATIDSTKNDEMFIDEMFEKAKFQNFKNLILTEVNQRLEISFQNEIIKFKDKCEKLLQQSYLNSKNHIQRLEEEIIQKNQVINDLITCFKNISALPIKNTLDGTTYQDKSPIQQLNQHHNSISDILDELNESTARNNDNEDKPTEIQAKSDSSIDARNKISLEYQLSLIRKREHQKYHQKSTPTHSSQLENTNNPPSTVQ